ncbi:MAG: hypothetical protein IPH07_39925 [Deltaproteobacteria bacterium]|nr:hypothetical protein [Deltaproteobacteria bacterium]MBK8240993.1 hypothetical protein [Deltaproteobacteria bacterium]MBK8714000.1 hypothetical protein [Deltaproteobacteria bacterium]MBP7291172.1 hypothetical protein [Nannocystaceae bacterium]
MQRWSFPLVLAACTSFVEPDPLVLAEPAVPPRVPVERVPVELVAPADDTDLAVSRAPLVRAPAQGIPNDARIELARRACYGACPIYDVVLTADGVVRFHGRHFVAQHGDREAKITTAAFAKLWRRLVAQDIAGLPTASSESGPADCEELRTDHPSAIVTLTATDVDARVFDDHGCRGNERLEAFRKLEDRIDAVAGTARWVGRCRTEICPR